MLTELKTEYFQYFCDDQGRYQGEYKAWYENGQLREQCFYVDDYLYGEFKRFWKNGQIDIQCFYDKGILHGEYRRYLINGSILIHCLFIDGKMCGEYKDWDHSGNLCKHHFVVNGNKVHFDEIPEPPSPTTEEDRLYYQLKYNVQLLPCIQK